MICRSSLGRFSLSQQPTRYANRAFRLLHINRFGQNQIGADLERLGHSALSLDNRHRKRVLVRSRIARRLEQQSRILLVVTIHDQGVEMLTGQFFDCGKRLGGRLHAKVKLGKNLGDGARGLFIGTE